MIKRIIKGIVLAVFFAGALLISNYVMNRGTDDKIMTMGEPTLPVVSFTVSGQEINLLSGYVDQMDVTAMRDTIRWRAMERFRLRSQRMEIRSVRSAIKFIHWMEQILTQKEKSKKRMGKLRWNWGLPWISQHRRRC